MYRMERRRAELRKGPIGGPAARARRWGWGRHLVQIPGGRPRRRGRRRPAATTLLLKGVAPHESGRRARPRAGPRAALLLSSLLLRGLGGVADFSRRKSRRPATPSRALPSSSTSSAAARTAPWRCRVSLDRRRVSDAAGEKFCERRRLLGCRGGRRRRRRRRSRLRRCLVGVGGGGGGRAATTTFRRFSDSVRSPTATSTRSRATSSGGVSATTPRRPLYSASDRPTSSTAAPTASDSSRAGECGYGLRALAGRLVVARRGAAGRRRARRTPASRAAACAGRRDSPAEVAASARGVVGAAWRRGRGRRRRRRRSKRNAATPRPARALTKSSMRL